MFDQLIVPLVESHRFSVIAPDRRGFGNSDWNTPTTGDVTFETFSADLVALLEHLNPGPFVFVAASMGCSETVLAHKTSAYIQRNCRGFVWIGPNMPYSVRCAECPDGPDPAIWESLADGFRSSEAKEFIAQQVPGVFRVDLGNRVGPRTLQFFERLVSQADPIALERTAIICQKPMAAELRSMAGGRGENSLPILILHGDSDAGMPVETSAAVVQKLLPWSALKVYEKAGHGEFRSGQLLSGRAAC
jgi:pimeloyl-ACP methyl ester carboxylesterase